MPAPPPALPESHFTTLFLDLNSYFASVEQQLNPALRGRPVAVIPVETDTTCCIAASYEAKAYGVKTGTNVAEARRMCPGIVFVSTRTDAYVRFHHRIIAAVESVLPVHQVFSIDEMSCRLVGSQQHPEAALALARCVKEVIYSRVGECLRCSIGLATNRFLAKLAADMQKPDGLVTISRADLPHKILGLVPRDLCGIGPRMEERLRRRGITTMAHLLALDERAMVDAWGSVVGLRYHRWLRGDDPQEAPTRKRSIGHQHVMPPELRTADGARAVLARLIHKAAARSRHVGWLARKMTIWIKFHGGGDWSIDIPLESSVDTLELIHLFTDRWPPTLSGVPHCVGVTLHDLEKEDLIPLPLFPQEQKRQKLARAMDSLNNKYGLHAIYPAAMHTTRDAAPARIGFTSIPDLDMPE
ncbi:MAG: hypothetical protein K1X53_09035 [Candidatus Sumerlaeaceae bacterium]|nr:hypothetical protein [Candidatus Sumerlaeaceae bacterium]